MRRRRTRATGTLLRPLRSFLEMLVLAEVAAGCGDGSRHHPDGGASMVVDARPGDVSDAPAGDGPGVPPVEPPGPSPLPAREAACADNLDNDLDGLVDCLDPDCAADLTCAFAPSLDRTVAPGFHDAVRFLYEGPHAVQLGADPTVFDAMRASVLRGRVLDRDGTPVEGVRVTVHDNDAYGYTGTRDGGVFDLVVNGGVPLTVSYEAAGFLPVQRTIDTGETRFRQYHWLPDVALTPRDPAVTEIVPGAVVLQVARGSVQEDADGARQATLVFSAGTRARAVLPDGSEMTLSSMHVRATEYTVGERGPEAMPGTLPATSGYTYAVELSVDEAELVGASAVVFDRPVGFYLENFLEFPVGTVVPLGCYDRVKAAWIPAESGVVLAILGHGDGLAAIDLDGDGVAEDDETLAAAGISADERVELVALYAPGQTLWRASIPHFTPWDCNWPFGPPDDADFPDDDFLNDPDRDVPCERGGSIIQCDPESGTLFLGDGTRRSARNVAPVLVQVADIPPTGTSFVTSMAMAADGTLYTGSSNGHVHRVPPGGPPAALMSTGFGVHDLLVAADGTLYLADLGRDRVLAVVPGGAARVVAGGGLDAFLAPGGAARPATEVALDRPSGLALAADGGLYIADHGHSVVRHVDPAGMLTTLEGVRDPWDVELGPDGSLYVAQRNERAVRRVHPDGRVEVVIGPDAGITPASVSVRADGTLLVADAAGGRILRVDADGTRTVVAGGGNRALAHGEISTAVGIPSLTRGGLDAEGRPMFTDGRRVYRVLSSVPGVSGDDIVVPSRDGGELYVFDRTGRHRETRDALTGVTLLAFEYDAHGRVIAVTDRDGLATRIERDARGLASAIVGPYGQRTALGYDELEQLASVRDPLQREVALGDDGVGRLTRMLDARGNEHLYTHDARGRLLTDVGPTGYTQTLGPAASGDGPSSGSDVAITTSRQRTTRYRAQRVSTDLSVRTMELPWGGRGTVHKYPARTELTAPDGTRTDFALASDPRWHTQTPWAREAQVRTPQGRIFDAASERAVSFEDPEHPHRITSLEQRHTVNGRTSTTRYDAAARTITSRTPGGKQRIATLDDLGRVVRVDQPGMPPHVVEYDDDGRIAQVQRGEGAEARVTLFHYDANGNLIERVDPLQRVHVYEHDVIGRLRAQEGPDGTRIALDYDAHDNLTRLTPPGRPAHQLRYAAADQAERYIPPPLAGVDAEVGFRYDADLAPEIADGPGDQQVTLHHDHAGRIESIALARGDYVHEYDPATGHLAHLVSPDAVGLHFGRDGPLPRDTRLAVPGAADVIVALDHDDAFRPWTLTIQGEPPIEHGYDADDHLIQAGPLTIVRDPQTGLPDVTRAGAIETNLDVSQFAEPERFSATFSGQPLYEATYERDALGRITHLTETIAGQLRSVTYDYDDADRLAYVEEHGQPARELRYDPNGNLVEIREAGIPILTATHDAQDRLVTHGRFVLTHTDSGHLASQLDTLTGESKSYRYDELGNLLGADLADGRSIQYLIDGADRRVAKLIDGELQWLFAYAGSLPIARLHPDGSAESIYVYGALAHVPDVILKAGRTYRIIHDHLGSPRLVVDVETGAIAQSLDYDVHGRVLADTAPDFQPFAFAGGLHDIDTGLARFGARDYDPDLARWTAKDPSGFAGGDTNLYAYAYGDPVNFVDPDGELAFLVPLAVLALKGRSHRRSHGRRPGAGLAAHRQRRQHRLPRLGRHRRQRRERRHIRRLDRPSRQDIHSREGAAPGSEGSTEGKCAVQTAVWSNHVSTTCISAGEALR
jgi:RHS repeat-associated protein